MQNLLNDLTLLLEQDSRLVAEGKLLKNKVVELALALDPSLIKLLLKHDAIRKHFFVEVENVLVFDKIKFQRFVSNKQFLPDSYTSFKNKIGLTANSEYLTESKEVVLAWPYKDCMLEGGQDKEDARRNEVFWNETLAPDQIDRLLSPKALTGFKRYDKDGEHPVANLSLKDNLIIKGNNLLALHTLMNVYAGKVKLIYIDPPYNTGNDSFNYNDSFNHSTWLTFMRNRLEVALTFLSNDGVMCINIDDKEVFYLKALCDEVFGRSNFLTNIIVKTSDPSGHKTVNPAPYSQSEYILMYARNKAKYKYSINYVPSDYDAAYSMLVTNFEQPYNDWEFEKLPAIVAQEHQLGTAADAKYKLGELGFLSLIGDYALKNKERIFQLTAISDDAGKEIVSIREQSAASPGKVFKVDRGEKEPVYVYQGRQVYFYSSKVKIIDGIETPAKPLTNIWVDIPYNGISKEGGVILKNGKKPEKLLRRVIEICTEKEDLVMDFNAGSGTSLAVAHKTGRRYIGIEQLDYGINDVTSRLKNVIAGDKSGISKLVKWSGGGNFVCCEMNKANQAFIGQIQAATSSKSLQVIWQAMQERAFLSYKLNPKTIDANQSEFESLVFSDQQCFLIEVLDKNLLYVPYSEIDDASYVVSDADKALNKQFFNLK